MKLSWGMQNRSHSPTFGTGIDIPTSGGAFRGQAGYQVLRPMRYDIDRATISERMKYGYIRLQLQQEERRSDR